LISRGGAVNYEVHLKNITNNCMGLRNSLYMWHICSAIQAEVYTALYTSGLSNSWTGTGYNPLK
jgi:hypothetical protein